MDINARQIDSLDFNYLSQAETYHYSTEQLARAKSSSAIMAKLSAEVGAWDLYLRTFTTLPSGRRTMFRPCWRVA